MEDYTAKISAEGSATKYQQNQREIWQALKIDSQERFWGRGFRGLNVADFWVRTSYMLIMLDLFLIKFSETWGPL